MLRNNRLRLRAVEPEDLDLMYVIENDTALWPMGNATVPYSHYALKQYINDSANDIFHDRQLRLVIEKADGTSIGFLDLHNFDPQHQRAEVGIVVLQEAQRQGLATEALQLLSDYASLHMGLHQLCALVPAGNVASLALFRRCGYKETATLQDWLKSPRGWQSVVVFQKMLAV